MEYQLYFVYIHHAFYPLQRMKISVPADLSWQAEGRNDLKMLPLRLWLIDIKAVHKAVVLFELSGHIGDRLAVLDFYLERHVT